MRAAPGELLMVRSWMSAREKGETPGRPEDSGRHTHGDAPAVRWMGGFGVCALSFKVFLPGVKEEVLSGSDDWQAGERWGFHCVCWGLKMNVREIALPQDPICVHGLYVCVCVRMCVCVCVCVWTLLHCCHIWSQPIKPAESWADRTV